MSVEISVSPVVAALTVTPGVCRCWWDKPGMHDHDCPANDRVLSWVYVPTPEVEFDEVMPASRTLRPGDSVVIRADGPENNDGHLPLRVGVPFGDQTGQRIELRSGSVGTATISAVVPVVDAQCPFATNERNPYEHAHLSESMVHLCKGLEDATKPGWREIPHLLPFFPGLVAGGFLLGLSNVEAL